MPPLTDSRFARLVGLTEAKRQLGALPEVVRRPVYAVVQASTVDMANVAKAYAPRRDPSAVPGYSGGELESRIAGRASLKHLVGVVGIEKGARVVIRGRSVAINKTTAVTHRRLKKDGTYVMSRRRRVLGQTQRAKVRAVGGLVIQPTKYGHLMEFGRTGGRGRIAPRSYLRSAAKRSQTAFTADLKAVLSADVIAAVRAMGLQARS